MCRDIHPIPVDHVILDHHVTQVDTDTEVHTAIIGKLGILLRKAALNFHRTLYRIHHRGELGQDCITLASTTRPLCFLISNVKTLR